MVGDLAKEKEEVPAEESGRESVARSEVESVNKTVLLMGAEKGLGWEQWMERETVSKLEATLVFQKERPGIPQTAQTLLLRLPSTLQHSARPAGIHHLPPSPAVKGCQSRWYAQELNKRHSVTAMQGDGRLEEKDIRGRGAGRFQLQS